MNLLFLGGGLWIIPVLLFAAAAYFAVIAVKKSKSGSHYQDPKTGKYVDTPGGIPVTQIGQFWFAVGFAAFGIISLLLMYSDR